MKKLSSLLIFLAAILMPFSSRAGDWNYYLIGLDPGHGGSDPGALGPSAPHEAELALNCALWLNHWIVIELGGRVNLTRTSDTYVSLEARREYSVAWDPYIFCSIHLNSFNGTAHGTETWYYHTSNSYSLTLANCVQNTLIEQMGLTNRGVKNEAWTVITGSASVPAILTEGLFVDNPSEWGLIHEIGSTGFFNWVRGHIYGFHDYMKDPNNVGNGGVNVDPRTIPAISGAAQSSMNVSTDNMYFECRRKDRPTQQFSVSGSGLSNDIIATSSDPSRFTVNGGGSTNLGTGGGTVTVQFVNANELGAYWSGGNGVNSSFSINVSSGDKSHNINVSAYVYDHRLNEMEEVWNFSEKLNTKTQKGYDASKINNIAYHNGRLYCVYEYSSILILDAATGDMLGKLIETDLCQGGTYKFSDVKVLQGNIVACNKAVRGEELRVYAWSDDESEPYFLYNSPNFNDGPSIGDCMELNGNFYKDLWLTFGSDDGTTSRIIEYRREGPEWTTKITPVINPDGSHHVIGENFRVYHQDAGWWIDGNDSYPYWSPWRSEQNAAVVDVKLNSAQLHGSCQHEFSFDDGRKYAASVIFDDKLNGRVVFAYDNLGNYSDELRLNSYPAEGLGSETPNVTGRADVAIDTDGQFGYVSAWVFSEGQGLAYYRYGSAPVYAPDPVEPAQGTANAYAYGLNSEIDMFEFTATYSLNAPANSVDILILDEEDNVCMEQNYGAQSAGAHTESFDVSQLENDKRYKWAVRVDGGTRRVASTFGSYRFYNPRGVDVDNSMESEHFGNVYCTEGTGIPSSVDASIYHSGTGGSHGLYAFTASLEPITNPKTGKYAFMGGLTPNETADGAWGADLAKVRVADDGRVFVTRCNSSGDYILYAPNFADLLKNDRYTSLLQGGSFDASTYIYSVNGNFVAAANVGFDIKGSGDNLKMVALSGQKGLFTYTPTYSRVDQYDLGSASALPVASPVSTLSGRYTTNTESATVDYDDRGGIWYCQFRFSPEEELPALVYVDAYGNEKYKDISTARGGGGVRVSPDGSMIAIPSSTENLSIYSVTFDGNGTPQLTERYNIIHGIGQNVYDIAWDIADNIYICGNWGEYLKAFALPHTGAVTTTAPSKFHFTKLSTGVDSISEDSIDAPVEYYNLQGVKVKNPSNGIYIVRRGNKVTKEFIR